MLAAIFVGVGLIVALVLPRWWVLVFLPPVVVVLVGLVDSPLPPGLHWWIALVAGAATAFGIGLGLLIRRLARQGAASGAV
jgi:hypothetical protein